MTSTPILSVLAGRHLIVTGVTGFVGKVWLSMLLTRVPDIGRITVVVRRTRKLSGLQRMADQLDRSPAFRELRAAHPHDLASFIDDRLEVVEGDLKEPMLGLDEATVSRLALSADAVVHLAGLTEFQPDPRRGIPANVRGAWHAADLAARLVKPRLIHVSTCYVAGLADGQVAEAITPGVGPEGTCFDPAQVIDRLEAELAEIPTATARIDLAAERALELGWPNLYTFSKAMAEHLLAKRHDIDLTVVRPSVVECARTFPMPGWNEGLNTSAPIMWFCSSAFRELPSSGDHRFDIIPVDAVCRWLTVVTARHLEGEAEAVYQFGSSDHNPTTFDRIIELTSLGARRYARRPGATLMEKVAVHLDTGPANHKELGWFTPETLASTAKSVSNWLDDGPVSRLPDWLGESVKQRSRARSRKLRKSGREMNQLGKMLEIYRPFIHDHDYVFETDRIRGLVDALPPEDAWWADDLHTIDWRQYWLDVQYPGVVTWSFPLLDGAKAPLDAPSTPPLELGQRPERLQGAA